MEVLEQKLKETFGNDYSEEYIARIDGKFSVDDLIPQTPPFQSHPAFGNTSYKHEFLLDERVISFFKVAPDEIHMALVLYNFSNEEVEVRWSPEFACDNIREVLHEELITLDEEELVFIVKPQQLQWVCFERVE